MIHSQLKLIHSHVSVIPRLTYLFSSWVFDHARFIANTQHTKPYPGKLNIHKCFFLIWFWVYHQSTRTTAIWFSFWVMRWQSRESRVRASYSDNDTSCLYQKRPGWHILKLLALYGTPTFVFKSKHRMGLPFWGVLYVKNPHQENQQGARRQCTEPQHHRTTMCSTMRAGSPRCHSNSRRQHTTAPHSYFCHLWTFHVKIPDTCYL